MTPRNLNLNLKLDAPPARSLPNDPRGRGLFSSNGMVCGQGVSDHGPDRVDGPSEFEFESDAE